MRKSILEEEKSLYDQCIERSKEQHARFALISGISTARLRELAEAERDGRVVVLPCKRGTTFFAVNKDRGYIYEQDYDYPEVVLMENRRNGKSGNRGYTFLGKGKKTKIYLSRAEAERALAATEPKGEATT